MSEWWRARCLLVMSRQGSRKGSQALKEYKYTWEGESTTGLNMSDYENKMVCSRALLQRTLLFVHLESWESYLSYEGGQESFQNTQEHHIYILWEDEMSKVHSSWRICWEEFTSDKSAHYSISTLWSLNLNWEVRRKALGVIQWRQPKGARKHTYRRFICALIERTQIGSSKEVTVRHSVSKDMGDSSTFNLDASMGKIRTKAIGEINWVRR